MNFKLFNDEKTWEREDCDLKLAEYIMCEINQDGKDSGKHDKWLYKL
jgi:hypothetical protein